jgi:hypothetical protein
MLWPGACDNFENQKVERASQSVVQMFGQCKPAMYSWLYYPTSDAECQ